MPYDLYDLVLFSFFIFVLVIELILFINRLRKNKNSPRESSLLNAEREKKLFKLYENLEDTMDGFESYIQEVRDEIEQTKSLALREIRVNASQQIIQPVNRIIPVENIEKNEKAEEKKEIKEANTEIKGTKEKTREQEKKFTHEKNEIILKLYREGLSADEIAKELNAAKGEINLIIGLERN